MKLKISHLETPTQEVFFLLTIMTCFFIITGSTLFLLAPADQLQTFFGILGTQILFDVFYTLGFATFLIALSVLFLGSTAVLRCHGFLDFFRHIYFFSLQLCFHICFWVLSASFLTVIHTHIQFFISPRLLEGAGGLTGQMIGGNLYDYFGLYGALMILLSSTLIIGILGGQIALAHLLMEIKEQCCDVLFYILKLCRKIMAFGLLQIQALLQTCGWNVTLPNPFIKSSPHTNNTQNQDEPLDSGKTSQEPLADHLEQAQTNFEYSDQNPSKESLSVENAQNKPSPKDNKPASDQPKPLHITIKKWTKTYKKPSIHLLSAPPKQPKSQDTKEMCEHLETSLQNFQIKGKIIKSYTSATLTLYEFQPSPGVKVSKITKLTDDLALLLGARAIRILTPIPGKTTVGIEVPNKNPYQISFREMVKSFEKKQTQLPLALGMDVYNKVVIEDLQAMPHLLVSGTTGSGKSVFINIAVNSLLFNRSPKHLRLLMIDPKMIELTPYNRIPHLLHPVVTDLTEAKEMLCWAEREMDLRYQKFADIHARNIMSFNETIKKSSKKTLQRRMGKNLAWEWVEMPYIVIIIDELADLMITQGKLVETPITRIAQKARACGIHLIIATQRPSTDIVTGLIKTNFPTRIAFKVSSSIDSRTILDSTGAEKLLGKGDMLFMQPGGHLDRLQGCFISEADVRKINGFLTE